MITASNHGRRVDTLRDEPPARPLRPIPTDFGIEGPDRDDFLKQEGALHAIARVCLVLLAGFTFICLAFSLGFFGRHLGLF